MAVVGIRSRDQVWQLGLVAVLGVVVLVAGVIAFGRASDEDTSAGSHPGGDKTLEAVTLAGPSAANDRPGGALRSVGAIDETGEESSTPATRPVLIAGTTERAESTSTTSDGDTVTSVTAGDRTTTTAVTTTTRPIDTTAPPATKPATSSTETTTPTSTTQKPTITLPPTSDVTYTLPTVTIRPPIGGHSITPEDLKKARKRWQSTGYRSYSMTVLRTCFCPPSYTGPFDVVVKNGTVISVTRPDQDSAGQTIDREQLTVPALFDLIDAGFDADQMDVTFNQKTGVPERISIDYIFGAVDDELTVQVSNFSPHRDRDDD